MRSGNTPTTNSEIAFKAVKTEFHFVNEDCIKGMRRLRDKSVDVVVTSPPYNLGIKYTNYHDRRKSDEYLLWSVQWATEVHRVLKDEGSFFLNLGACPSNPLVPHELIVEIKKFFTLQNTFHWIKSITIQKKDGELVSAGHFKPLNSKRYVNDCHEYVFHLTKAGSTLIDRLAIGVPYSDKSNIARWKHTGGSDKRCRGNNWFIPYKTINSRLKERPHPATFPSELAVFCFMIHGLRSDLVALDPFLGIGHSAEAAKKCEIGTFWGFDVDGEYLEVARKGILTGSTAPTQDFLRKMTPRSKKIGDKQDGLFD